MFKTVGFEEEIYHSMEKQLVSNQVEDNFGFNKLAKATDLLNTAATIFENANMHEEAVEITKIIQQLVMDLK